MIPRTQQAAYPPSWQDELKSIITCPKVLFEALELPLSALPSAQQAHALFKVRVTLPYLNRIKKGDLNDPLLKQVLPLEAEQSSPEHYSDDPLAESHHNPVKGVIHKYNGRVLLIAASQCAINCRYCFRRNFDYQANSPSRAQWQESLAYIHQTPSINEVILSGGDPLVLSDSTLSWLIAQIEQIPHITRVRIHTRLPIVLPHRITPALTTLMQRSRLNAIMVIHCNHPNEIDNDVVQALTAIKHAGITLLNQAVLLANINNNAQTLIALSEQLFNAGVLPYYLHLMDTVKGAAHFSIPESEAIALHQQMQANLPGFLVPKLVREIPHRAHKTLIF
ncbi:EF-P beta-lysylation protein EpmB [Marinagarivorans algicola]|uniref:EF-P beta-lysylation protein EpmB n=1 Tax=Marinagarivorans algicola TaxID=1513270 RepID=UPI0006B9A027|nr:EF-P beta-lysylation protein EpmB [Marinagarivorans algicola]